MKNKLSQRRKLPYFKWLNRFWDGGHSAKLTFIEMKVLFCFYRHVDPYTLRAFVSVKKIAEKLRFTNNSHVSKAFCTLTKKGFLITIEAGGRKHASLRELVILKYIAPESGAMTTNNYAPDSGALRARTRRITRPNRAQLRARTGPTKDTVGRTYLKDNKEGSLPNGKKEGAFFVSSLGKEVDLSSAEETIVSGLNKFGIDRASSIFAENPRRAGSLLFCLTIKKATGEIVSDYLAKWLANSKYPERPETPKVLERWKGVGSGKDYLNALKNIGAEFLNKTVAQRIERDVRANFEKTEDSKYNEMLIKAVVERRLEGNSTRG